MKSPVVGAHDVVPIRDRQVSPTARWVREVERPGGGRDCESAHGFAGLLSGLGLGLGSGFRLRGIRSGLLLGGLGLGLLLGEAALGGIDLALVRGEDDCDVATGVLGGTFDLGDVGEFLADALDSVHADFLVRDFASAETLAEEHLVALHEEAAGLLDADLDIVIVDLRRAAQADFLEFLALAGVAFLLLGLLVLVLAVVHDFAERRADIGLDLDEIEARFFRHAERFARLDDTDLIVLMVDEADGCQANLVIHTLLADRTGLSEIAATNGRTLRYARKRSPVERERRVDAWGVMSGVEARIVMKIAGESMRASRPRGNRSA